VEFQQGISPVSFLHPVSFSSLSQPDPATEVVAIRGSMQNMSRTCTAAIAQHGIKRRMARPHDQCAQTKSLALPGHGVPRGEVATKAAGLQHPFRGLLEGVPGWRVGDAMHPDPPVQSPDARLLATGSPFE